MKVLRNRARKFFIVLCAIAGVVMGAGLPNALKLTAFMPTVQAANASMRSAFPSVSPGVPVQTCPPTTIDGTIGSGSPDFPFVTGTQTSRLFRNAVESGCATAKPNPGLIDGGIQFKYDAYTFHNSSILPVCITIITTNGANNQLLAAAYQDTFNPADVQSHYIGDAGNSDKTRSFSFTVDGTSNFVIVQSRVNNAPNAPSLDYSFRLLGLPGCESCPPTDISGIIGDAHTEYPKAMGTQTGRIFRNSVASVCSPAKPVPAIEDPTEQFSYDAFTFLNHSRIQKCVTVTTTAGANNQIFTAAYLDRFNPLDVQENYLGDAGNSNQSRTFSFIVPARRSFVIVQHRVNNAANPTSLAYNFSISGLPNCDCVATLSETSASFTNLGGHGLLNITVPAECTWSVDNFSTSFVTINGPTSGNGSATIVYTVAPNSGSARKGTLAVGGQTFTIFQGF